MGTLNLPTCGWYCYLIITVIVVTVASCKSYVTTVLPKVRKKPMINSTPVLLTVVVVITEHGAANVAWFAMNGGGDYYALHLHL